MESVANKDIGNARKRKKLNSSRTEPNKSKLTKGSKTERSIEREKKLMGRGNLKAEVEDASYLSSTESESSSASNSSASNGKQSEESETEVQSL